MVPDLFKDPYNKRTSQVRWLSFSCAIFCPHTYFANASAFLLSHSEIQFFMADPMGTIPTGMGMMPVFFKRIQSKSSSSVRKQSFFCANLFTHADFANCFTLFFFNPKSHLHLAGAMNITLAGRRMEEEEEEEEGIEGECV